jgi:hypothetical protein
VPNQYPGEQLTTDVGQKQNSFAAQQIKRDGFPQLTGYLGNHHAVAVGRYDIPGPAIAQGYGCIVILLVYLSATGMRKEKYCWARRKYPATGWLPDDYQIAGDLLLMIDIETRSEE